VQLGAVLQLREHYRRPLDGDAGRQDGQLNNEPADFPAPAHIIRDRPYWLAPSLEGLRHGKGKPNLDPRTYRGGLLCTVLGHRAQSEPRPTQLDGHLHHFGQFGSTDSQRMRRIIIIKV